MKLSKIKIDELCAQLQNFESKNVTPRDAKQWANDISDTLSEYLPDTNFAEVVQRIFGTTANCRKPRPIDLGFLQS